MPGTGFGDDDPTEQHPAWPLYFCNFKQSWEKSQGALVTIVHPDTGWTRHPELIKGHRYLADVYPLSQDFRRGGSASAEDPLNPTWMHGPAHGTTVASTMIGGFGVFEDLLPDYDRLADEDYASGVAPLTAVIPQRVVDNVLLTSSDCIALARAIGLASRVREGWPEVGVISISLGGMPSTRLAWRHLSRALADARVRGIIVCAAAGQLVERISERLPVAYPGRSVHTICAAACDHEHRMLPGGFYGSEVDISVPGVNVAVARTVPRASATDPPKYGYERSEGSSYATGMLAGACALWLARHGRDRLIGRYGRRLMLDGFKLAVFRTCDRRGGDWNVDEHGKGVLDVAELLRPDLDDLPTRSEVQILSERIGWSESPGWGD